MVSVATHSNPTIVAVGGRKKANLSSAGCNQPANQLELSNQISTLLMINNQMISGSVLRWCASICQVTDNFINFHSVSQNSRQPNTFKQNMTLAVALDSYFLATIPCTVVILFWINPKQSSQGLNLHNLYVLPISPVEIVISRWVL